MILEKLVDYYEREAEKGNIAPYGWENKSIPFIISLNEDGSFAGLIPTRSDPKDVGRIVTIPKTIERSGKNSWQTTFLLWDHIGYVLGLVTEKEKEETVEKQHASFKKKLQDLPEEIKQDKGINAVIQFLEKGDFSGITEGDYWEELYKKKPNVTFSLSSSSGGIIAQRPLVKEHVNNHVANIDENALKGICSLTGQETTIARTHAKIKGVIGAQTSGAAIVSFNDSAYTSYGKKQNYNAPVGEYATFAYTTGLNHLLRKGSINKLQIGDTTIVFWTATDHPIIEVVSSLIGWDADQAESPRDLDSIRALLQSHQTGAKPVLEDETKFYVLGLSPNASRLSIRFWHCSTVKEMASRFLNYFEDIEIKMPPKWQRFPSLKRLLNTLALLQKTENLAPQLSGEFIRAIFEGRDYPRYALNKALQRNRAEISDGAFPYRMALIKAILTRTYKVNKEELTVSLNKDFKDVGYQLGCLFSVLEKTQEDAHKRNLNRTIGESYFGSASTLPGTVFNRLMALNKHHLKKLRSQGHSEKWKADRYQERISEILGVFDVSNNIDPFPIRLTIKQQGLFSVGYYHERVEGFPRNKNSETEQGE